MATTVAQSRWGTLGIQKQNDAFAQQGDPHESHRGWMEPRAISHRAPPEVPLPLTASNPTEQMLTNFGFGALIGGDRVVFLFSHGFGYGGNTGRLHLIACQYVNGRHADDPVPGVHEHQKEAA